MEGRNGRSKKFLMRFFNALDLLTHYHCKVTQALLLEKYFSYRARKKTGEETISKNYLFYIEQIRLALPMLTNFIYTNAMLCKQKENKYITFHLFLCYVCAFVILLARLRIGKLRI